MIIDCISDLHGHYPNLEGGDLLIVAGDLTARDTVYEHAEFLGWLNIQPYKKKIFIAGNHDNNIDDCFDWDDSISYLCDSGIKIYYDEETPKHPTKEPFKELKIWGSPWTLSFKGMNPKCKAFTLDTEEELEEKFALIPHDLDILITHGPMKHILDSNYNGDACGSRALRDAIEIKKPETVIFGHIHEQGGLNVTEKGILFINGSFVDARYKPNRVLQRLRIEQDLQSMQRTKTVERIFL